MTFEQLQEARTMFLKEGAYENKNILTNMIDAVQKASITPKGRLEITEQLVNETLIKYQKSVQEQVDTCPAGRPDLLARYTKELELVKEYAPQLLTDRDVIISMVQEILIDNNIEIDMKHRGVIMKTITPYFKGKADMKIVSETVSQLLKGAK